MEKETVDLLIALAKAKGSIQLQTPPSTDCTIEHNLLLINELDCEPNIFKEISSLIALQ